jgi:predicted 3-demethylubiquinone-9 3-methyltransferase (glyoxalase superfamily)
MSFFESYPRITPFLWFDGNAVEAAEFYVGIFKNSRILSDFKGSVDTTIPKGKVLVVNFELDGLKFTGLNAGPQFKFNKSISFTVRCDTQEEIDYYWSKLTADGGSEGDCGWLEDKFGLSWQITPAEMGRLISTPEGMQAMMTMQKLDIAALEAANKR